MTFSAYLMKSMSNMSDMKALIVLLRVVMGSLRLDFQ